jgi:hypothetical protein
MLIWHVMGFAGIEFIDENGGGPGVRLRKLQRRSQIVKRAGGALLNTLMLH